MGLSLLLAFSLALPGGRPECKEPGPEEKSWTEEVQGWTVQGLKQCMKPGLVYTLFQFAAYIQPSEPAAVLQQNPPGPRTERKLNFTFDLQTTVTDSFVGNLI